MKTSLDDVSSAWFLVGLLFHDGGLRVRLAEPKVGEEEPFTVGETVFHGTRPVTVDDTSEMYEVRFEDVFVFEVIDEGYTQFDEYDQADSTKDTVRVHERSRFLDRHKNERQWMFDHQGPLKHFSVGTYDVVIDLLCREDPVVERVGA